MLLLSDYITLFKLYRKTENQKARVVMLSIIHNRYREQWEIMLDAYNSYRKRIVKKQTENLGYASPDAVKAMQEFNALFELDKDVAKSKTLQALYVNAHSNQRQKIKHVLQDMYKFTADDFAKLDKQATNDASLLRVTPVFITKEENPLYVTLRPYKENTLAVVAGTINAIFKRTGLADVLPDFSTATESVKDSINNAIKKLQEKLGLPVTGELNCKTMANLFVNLTPLDPVKKTLENLLLSRCKFTEKQIEELSKKKPIGTNLIKTDIEPPDETTIIEVKEPAPEKEKESLWRSWYWWIIGVILVTIGIKKLNEKEEKENGTKRKGKKSVGKAKSPSPKK